MSVLVTKSANEQETCTMAIANEVRCQKDPETLVDVSESTEENSEPLVTATNLSEYNDMIETSG